MSRVPLRCSMAALACLGCLTGPVCGQIRIQLRGGAGGAIQIVPNAPARMPSPHEGLSTAPIFVENRAVTAALESAREILDNLEDLDPEDRVERLQRAIGSLQQVLDLERDFCFYPTKDDERTAPGTPPADGFGPPDPRRGISVRGLRPPAANTATFRSTKAEAEQMLLELPREGRELYEAEYGPAARAMLAEAIDRSRVADIEEVVRRYFHTAAGYEATYRLGSFHLDRGEPMAAALVFERLRQAGVERWEPMLSLKTAVAWGRAGMPENSVKTLLDFRARHRGDSVELGGERVPLFVAEADALPWLTRVMGRAPDFQTLGQEQWTMFRGNPARVATSRPASPLWNVRWRYPTIERSGDADGDRLGIGSSEQLGEVFARFLELEDAYLERGLVAQPAMHPIVVGDTVVFRTMQNVRAVDLASGELVWESALDDRNFERLIFEDAPTPNPVANLNRLAPDQLPGAGVAATPLEKFVAQRSWQDLTAGTLASDGRFVYSVEELDFLDGWSQMPNGMMVQAAAAAGRAHNKLVALELSTGKLVWELGGPKDEVGLELAGAYFLGPPLVLGNRLFVMLERAGEIQLAMIEGGPPVEGVVPAEPRMLWTQSLITPEEDITLAPLRKLAGLVPSYADGVVVCPTASGAVVGVDLARRQLAWGYRYATAMPTIPGNPFIGRNVNVANPTGNDDEDRWLDSAPTIAEGRIVLTPRDSGEMHCIDVATGNKVWGPVARRDGLFVAGVHEGNVIVVGRSQIRAYRLADGTDAWSDPIPTGLPAGRGVQTGSLYHLPLRDGGIATIDLAGARLLATSPSPLDFRRGLAGIPPEQRAAVQAAVDTPEDERNHEQLALLERHPDAGRVERHVPGNLVAAGGGIVSLSPHEVVAFESLAEVEQDVEGALERNPGDVAALTRRGALRLHQGREQAALADLERAIEAGAGAETRELYVATLLEGLRLDFAAYRDRAAASISLIDDVDQKRAYLRLHARGLEQIGEREQAFAEYVKLAGLESGTARLEQTSGRLAVRSDRWIRPRLAELFAEAPSDQKAAMAEMLETEVGEAIEADDPDRLRRLAGALGRLEIAERARRALVGKLDRTTRASERALLLDRLRTSADDETAGWATAELAKSAVEAGRFADAAGWFDVLEREFGDTPVLDGRTGSEFVADWSAREGVAARLVERETPWPETPMVVDDQATGEGFAQSWPVFVEGPPGPYYRHWTFELDNGRQKLLARDPLGVVAWSIDLARHGRVVPNVQGNFVRLRGHVVVVCLGTWFAVVDPLHESGGPEVLWSRALSEPGENVGGFMQLPAPGGFRNVVLDRFRRPLGTVGAATDDAVYYQVDSRLYAADLLTGDVLWELRNVARGSLVRADDDLVFVVEADDTRASVLRADDGHLVADRREVGAPSEQVLFEGRHVLSWTTTPVGRRLSLRDVSTGEELWSEDLPRAAWISLIDGEEVAVREDGGRFRVLRIGDGAPLVEAVLPRSTTIASITVLRTPERYLMFPHDPALNANNIRNVGISSNSPIVNGEVVAFDRETGGEVWRTMVENQALPLGQAPGLPVVALTARNFRIIVRQQGRNIETEPFSLLLLDTRTGRVLLEDQGTRQAYPYSLASDPENDVIALSFYQRRVELRFAEPEAGEAGKEGDDESK